jgi:hypothetical protein
MMLTLSDLWGVTSPHELLFRKTPARQALLRRAAMHTPCCQLERIGQVVEEVPVSATGNFTHHTEQEKILVLHDLLSVRSHGLIL